MGPKAKRKYVTPRGGRTERQITRSKNEDIPEQFYTDPQYILQPSALCQYHCHAHMRKFWITYISLKLRLPYIIFLWMTQSLYIRF